MRKRNRLRPCCCTMLSVIVLLSVGGCWNYQGLNQMAIVAGMALDYDPETKQYSTTFEIIDLSKPVKIEGLSTVDLSSEGETIFHAIRNAKKKIKNKLYFGHMMVVIVSEELAKSDKILTITNWFLRDGECRETIDLLISQEKSAAEIFKAENVETAILSYEIENILDTDNKITLSAYSPELFNIYNKLNTDGEALSLPAIHLVYRDEESRLEVNGTAIFKDKTLAGYLSPDESKYLLFALDEVEGGILTVQGPDSDETNITLEIEKSKTSSAFRVVDGEPVVELKVTTDVFIGEADGQFESSNKAQISRVAKAAQEKLEQRIKEVIDKLQNEYKADALGFGKLIHKQDQKLWGQVKDNWEEVFKSLSVNITAKVNIKNTAMLKK